MSLSASSPQLPDTITTPFQLLTFCVGTEEYGVNAIEVDQVLVPQPITRLPHTPAYVLGVITQRGQVIPVIDLRRRLGLPPAEPTRETSIIAIRTKGLAASLLVDRITGFITVCPQDVSLDNVAGNEALVTAIALPGGSPKRVLNLQRLMEIREETLRNSQ